jgi:hypothetical protein
MVANMCSGSQEAIITGFIENDAVRPAQGGVKLCEVFY